MSNPSVDMHPSEINDIISKRLVHEVHTSERKSFRGCRRRWYWIFQDFYYPQVTAKPLEFGVAFHNAMETLYEPKTWWMTKVNREVVLNAAIEVFVNTCEKQRKKFGEVSPYGMTPEGEQDYDERLELGKGMLSYYWNDIAPYYDAHLKPIKVEVEFIVPIQGPNGEYLFCHCNRCWRSWCRYVDTVLEKDNSNWVPLHLQPGEKELWQTESPGLLVTLAGRIDMLAQDEHGDLWIVDWKTAARLSRGDASGQDRDEFLELDDQIGSYVMALRRKLGLNVRGFIYTELKKAFPQAPTRNAVQRLGCWFSKNKQQPTDYDTYLRTVKEEDSVAYEAGSYDDILAYLKKEGPRFHGRYQIHKSDVELEQIEHTLFAEASDMCDGNIRIYPAPGRFSCGFCAFRQPCLEKFQGGDYQYLLDTAYDKRKTHYWVKELSTDKQGGE